MTILGKTIGHFTLRLVERLVWIIAKHQLQRVEKIFIFYILFVDAFKKYIILKRLLQFYSLIGVRIIFFGKMLLIIIFNTIEIIFTQRQVYTTNSNNNRHYRLCPMWWPYMAKMLILLNVYVRLRIENEILSFSWLKIIWKSLPN